MAWKSSMRLELQREMQNLALGHSLEQCMPELLHWSNLCSLRPRHFDKMPVAGSACLADIAVCSADAADSAASIVGFADIDSAGIAGFADIDSADIDSVGTLA